MTTTDAAAIAFLVLVVLTMLVVVPLAGKRDARRNRGERVGRSPLEHPGRVGRRSYVPPRPPAGGQVEPDRAVYPRSQPGPTPDDEP